LAAAAIFFLASEPFTCEYVTHPSSIHNPRLTQIRTPNFCFA
jgi:hypothetical protein